MKYICKDCPKPCEIIVEDGSDTPMCCPYKLQWHAVNWHEVDETLQDKQLPKDTFDEAIKKYVEQYHNGPEKNALPDWCKVGEWVFDKDEQKYGKIEKFSAPGYVQVKYSDGNCVDNIQDEITPARLRPYTAEEMKALLGKVVGNEHGNMFLVTAFVADECEVCLDGVVYNADDLLECYTINGKPCGVLEHFDSEREEWIE